MDDVALSALCFETKSHNPAYDCVKRVELELYDWTIRIEACDAGYLRLSHLARMILPKASFFSSVDIGLRQVQPPVLRLQQYYRATL